MPEDSRFIILDDIDSTNNCAMASIHEEMASDGMAWFALSQNMGRGQRGKIWTSRRGDNIILSVAIKPPPLFNADPFLFNALSANICRRFVGSYVGENVNIKWPNDLYINDRKAGGLLIENIYRGKIWKWSVLGMGINVNQTDFPEAVSNAISLKQVIDRQYDVISMGRELHRQILDGFGAMNPIEFSEILHEYNRHLYKKGETVRLRYQKKTVIETRIEAVNQQGQLCTRDDISRQFTFGEVEWIL